MDKVITIPEGDVADMKKEAIDFDYPNFKSYLEDLIKLGRERKLLHRNLKKKTKTK
jgi:hypothetical protein